MAQTESSSAPHQPNKERQDLPVPLPASWTKEDLKDMVIHDSAFSPPCCKVRAVLRYFNVPYRTVRGRKKGSAYKGIPVLMVNGRQINDSYIILKTLAPILTGEALTKEQLELDDICTFGLMPALECALLDSGSEIRRCGSAMGGCACFRMCCMSLCFPCCHVSSRFKKAYGDLKEVEVYADQLQARLGDREFFHGAAAGIGDLAIYGLLAPFFRADVEVLRTRTFGNRPTLQAWFDRMLKILPLEKIWTP